MKIKAFLLIGLLCSASVSGQQADSILTYRVELGGTAGGVRMLRSGLRQTVTAYRV